MCGLTPPQTLRLYITVSVFIVSVFNITGLAFKYVAGQAYDSDSV